MVFGWGKKKPEEKAIIETPTKKEIQLNDVPKIIEELNELRQSQTISDIKYLRNNTEPLIEELMKIGIFLEKDNLNIDDIDKHLSTIVIRGKKQVIDVIKKDVISLPEILSIDDAEKLDSSLNRILKKVGDVLGRQTRVIHIFAKKYAVQLKENLAVTSSNHSEIHNLLKNYDSTKITFDEITDALNQIKILKKTQLEKTQRIDEINKDIISQDEKISSIQNSIEETKSSENYKKYLNLKNVLDEFTNKKFIIKNKIDEQFAKISRPLSRYEYGSALDKEQKNLLSKLVENPFNVLLPQHKDDIIVILDNIKKGVSSGSISVKDENKSLSQIVETKEKLDGFVTQVSEYYKKQEKMKHELNSLNPDKLITLENESAKNISVKDNLQFKSKTNQDDIDEIDSNIPKLVSKIEDQLRTFSNTKYVILFP